MSRPPPLKDRAMAVSSLVLLAAVGILVLLSVGDSLGALLIGLGGLAVATAGAWWAITEQFPRRGIGLAGGACGVLLVAAAAAGASSEGASLARLIAAGLLAACAATFARLSVVSALHQIDLDKQFPRFQPRRPVLICNPRSGGGKVAQFDLVGAAQESGVEVVMMQEGSDLEQLARDAVARGADCLAMAGGDGSQALVAAVAVEHGLPFACVSAGTRNHFAIDLGLAVEDPRQAVAALRGGVIRTVDYALVGERLFVNNASLGVYAQIVQSEDYRDAKVATATETLPELLGSEEPFDLQFTSPDGQEVDGAMVILVSNNPYILGPRLDISQRRSLTTGELGVVAITARNGIEAAALVARTAAGLAGRDPNLHRFTAQTFRVRSRSGEADVGIDGEAMTLPTPLEFRIVPRGLRVLVPADNPEVAATKHYRALGVRGLWDIARGRQPKLGHLL